VGIFSVVHPTEPCALRSTQPLKVSTRDFLWGKGGRCVWLMTTALVVLKHREKSRALTYPEPLGPPRPVVGHLFFNVLSKLLESVTLLITVTKIYRSRKCQIGRSLSGIEENGRNWLISPKLCIKSCRAIIIRIMVTTENT